MHDVKKLILGTISGVALAVGTAGAEPPSTVDAGSATVSKEKITVVDSVTPGSAIKVKEDAKPGQKTATALQSVKSKEDAKPGQATTMKSAKGVQSGQ